MSWNTITDDEVLEEFTPTEKTVLNNIQASAENLPAILQRAVSMVRGKCKAGGNRVGPENTIPDQLVDDVIAYTRWKWLISVPNLKSLQTPARKEAYDEARKTFTAVAKGEEKIELPDEGTALDVNTPGNAAEVASKSDRKFTRTKMDGL